MDQDRIGGKVNPSATVRAQECSKSHSSYEDELGSYTAVEKRDFENLERYPSSDWRMYHSDAMDWTIYLMKRALAACCKAPIPAEQVLR